MKSLPCARIRVGQKRLAVHCPATQVFVCALPPTSFIKFLFCWLFDILKSQPIVFHLFTHLKLFVLSRSERFCLSSGGSM